MKLEAEILFFAISITLACLALASYMFGHAFPWLWIGSYAALLGSNAAELLNRIEIEKGE